MIKIFQTATKEELDDEVNQWIKDNPFNNITIYDFKIFEIRHGWTYTMLLVYEPLRICGIKDRLP